MRKKETCNLKRPVCEYCLWGKITVDCRNRVEHKLTVRQKKKFLFVETNNISSLLLGLKQYF